MRRAMIAAMLAPALAVPAAAAQTPNDAARIDALQREVDALKAQVEQLLAAQRAAQAPQQQPAEAAVASAPPPAAAQPAAPVQLAAAPPPATTTDEEKWYDRIRVRGYTQMRLNEIVSGDATAPAGRSRLRSVHDSAMGPGTNFALRRARLVLQGDVGRHVAFYLQPDFATAVSNQTAGERREGYVQLRDAYVDVLPLGDDRLRLRFGQAKVPYGWENLQSSSNRLTLDRSDAINSGIPGERDIGAQLYFTPPAVQAIWDRLDDDGQKLFGNYGAFGIGLYNGQGVNRSEANDGFMLVGIATWPFALDALGLDGQVLELGASGYRNRFRPELRAGGTAPVDVPDERVGLHAILYPQPFGIQAEWNWGRGPEYDPVAGAILAKPLEGGYVQAMGRIRRSLIGPFMPYARWQHYRGGWKAVVNAPRLETDEWELGIEFQPHDAIEFTLAYAHMTRREADERRTGRAEGDVIRAQLQFSY